MRNMTMNLRKKMKLTLVLLLICLVLMIAVSYAWLSLSLRPEVTSIDTNIGANGSLEIALLSDETYVDPVLIRTNVGSSAVKQEAVVSNLFWGNVIELSDERYGLSRISLLPARLNVTADEAGGVTVGSNMLQVAAFGLDGRISILSADTVSAVLEEEKFTYYTQQQRYGVRAIGTISNLTSQQTALAGARAQVQTYTAAASRTLRHIWRDNGPGITDILVRRYSEGSDSFTQADVAVTRETLTRAQEAVTYVDAALRQGIIGIAASQIQNESDFEELAEAVRNTHVPLSMVIQSVGHNFPEAYVTWITQLEKMKTDVQTAIKGASSLTEGCTWEQLEPLLDVVINAEMAYMGKDILASPEAFGNMTEDTVITLPPYSGVLANLSAYAGNFSAFCMWTETNSVEVRTADPNETPYLIQLEKTLEECKAAFGGWTRANLDDTYGFAVDMAFRCNMESNLLLQTTEALRIAGTSEYPATQGSGSYMRFTSEEMNTEQLLHLMDTIRIGFLDDRNALVGVAKLNVSNYEEREEGIAAPLYLYEYSLQENGSIAIGERRSEDSVIAPLNPNTPAVITVVVWLDGDHVDNSLVGYTSGQSMSGVLNLQFASSADLLPSNQTIKRSK